jgi:hypothetical protein
MQAGQARRRFKEIMPRYSKNRWTKWWKTRLGQHKPEHATLKGGRSDSEPDLAYMWGWDEVGASDGEVREAANQRAQQEQRRDLETAEGLRPEGDEDKEEHSFAHATDTVQRSERRKQKEWTLQTDTPIAESGANGYTCVHVTGTGNPKGLKLSRNFALVQSTSKPLSRANIGPDHVIEISAQ